MKAILQSIKPQYCELIAAGKKTIEVRKTKPNITTPFKVYIYETMERYKTSFESTNPCISVPNGGRIKPTQNGYRVEYFARGKGKVIGEYVCDYITTDFLISDTCISVEDLEKYSRNKAIYGWHISNLVIYDNPKELSEFHKPCINPGMKICALCEFADFENDDVFPRCINVLTRPPQNYCYVEEK